MKRLCLLVLAGVLACSRISLGGEAADLVLQTAGVKAGLCVHLGGSDASAAAVSVDLGKTGRFVVHHLVTSAETLAAVRQTIRAAGVCGSVSAEAWGREELPYADRLVNLLIIEPSAKVSDQEVRRILRPDGVALTLRGGKWDKYAAPWPQGMDEWTHQKHGPDNNPVSCDSIEMSKAPNQLRWISDTAQLWSHGVRCAGGRVFIFEKGTIRAHDAFNGVLLWEKSPGLNVSSSPGAAYGRPIATADSIYGFGAGGILAVEAATGEVREKFTAAGKPYDLILAEDVLVCRDEQSVKGLDPKSGKLLWTVTAPEHGAKLEKPAKGSAGAFAAQQLFAGGGRVYFTAADKTEKQTTDKKGAVQKQVTYAPRVVGVDLKTGTETYRYDDPKLGPVPYPLLYAGGVLLVQNAAGFVGLPTDGKGAPWTLRLRHWDNAGKKVEQTSTVNGRLRSCLYINGLIWLEDNTRCIYGDGEPPAQPVEKGRGWLGFDPRTGKEQKKVGYPADKSWSGRCYDDLGSADCILSQTMEIINVKDNELKHLRGVRGQCGIGFILGENAVFTPPNACMYCYPMVRGAVSYELPNRYLAVPDAARLARGPAFDEARKTPASAASGEWPMYRANIERTAGSLAAVKPEGLALKWKATLGSWCTQPVVAGGKALAVAVGEHRVTALDPDTGRTAWEFTAGGRVTMSPTVAGDVCLFGSHDGFVYCVRLSDGALVWRFNAAPRDRRIVAGEQVESPWPVVGSVLVHNATAYFLAGHLTVLDGGIHFWALDPATGRVKFHQELNGIKGEKAAILPTHWFWHEEHMVNNILVAHGDQVRLYDQHGGWEFDAQSGALTGQSAAVPQPGWPKGRLTPGDFEKAERWPWCGWDRITMAYFMRGQEPSLGLCIGMDPRNRYSDWYTGYHFVFPRQGAPVGVMLHKGSVEPIPWALPKSAEELSDPKKFRGTDEYKALAGKLWPAVQTGLHVKALIFAGDVVWLAGAVPAAPGPASDAPHKGELRALSLADGKELAKVEFEGTPAFDGLSTARGRLYVATSEGRVLCFGP